MTIKDALEKLRERGHNTVAIDMHVAIVERQLRDVMRSLGPDVCKMVADGRALTDAARPEVERAEGSEGDRRFGPRRGGDREAG